MNKSLWKHIGRLLKNHRLERGMTQQEVADNARLDRSTLARFEGGYAPIPFEKLIRLIRVLRLPFRQLTPTGIEDYQTIFREY